MTSQERGAQLRVGIFMAIGLSAVAAMVVYFGRFGDAVRSYYQIRVEYPNASGLLKGASVLLAGAKVGMVETAPVILPDMEGVYVDLKIYKEVEIPSASEFTVGSSGLLGDRFVQINLKKDARSSPPIAAGTTIKGKSETGMSEIFDQAGPVVTEVRAVLKKVDNITAKIDNDVLKESMMKDLNETVANLKASSIAFNEATKKIDGIIAKTESAIGSGDQAMTSAKQAADELKKAITDIRGLVQQVKSGQGALGVLLSDKQTAENIRALVQNLRQRGIIWYRDRDRDRSPESAPSR
jgi:ABC-type transporter Mla subunit MlaD